MKKIISLLLVVSLTAAIAIGGTLAYLTDRDSEANVFTVGNVEIDLNEDFEQGAELIPGVKIEKEATITNTGINDAYVWMTLAVPTKLDNADSASDNVLHWNVPGAFWDNYYTTQKYIDSAIANGYLPADSTGVDASKTWDVGTDVPMYKTTIDGVEYNVYTLLYNSAIKPGETTNIGLSEVYLDDHIDIDPEGNWYHVLDGEVKGSYWNSDTDGNPIIYVSAYAMQTDGFGSALEAYKAYNNQWDTNDTLTDGSNGDEWAAAPTLVATADELTAALNAGESVALTTDVELNDAPITIPANSDATLNLNGHTLSGVSTSTNTSNLIKVNKGASLTISNGTVSFSATDPDTDWNPEGFPSYANNTINNAGTLVIDGATIENKTPAGGASYAIDNYPGANLIINDGVIDGKGKTAIRLFANSATVETNVTVNGGTITGSRAIWIQLPGSKAEEAPPVNVTITGGTLTSTNDPNSDNYMAIYSYSYGQSASGVNVNISGGTFNGNVGFGGGSKVGAENVTVTGGTFNGKLGRYLANDGWEDIAKP